MNKEHLTVAMFAIFFFFAGYFVKDIVPAIERFFRRAKLKFMFFFICKRKGHLYPDPDQKRSFGTVLSMLGGPYCLRCEYSKKYEGGKGKTIKFMRYKNLDGNITDDGNITIK